MKERWINLYLDIEKLNTANLDIAMNREQWMRHCKTVASEKLNALDRAKKALEEICDECIDQIRSSGIVIMTVSVSFKFKIDDQKLHALDPYKILTPFYQRQCSGELQILLNGTTKEDLIRDFRNVSYHWFDSLAKIREIYEDPNWMPKHKVLRYYPNM